MTTTTMAPAADLESPHEERLSSWYMMYGMRVRSDFPLPMAPEPALASGDTGPDLVFVRAGGLGDAPEPEGDIAGTLTCEHGTVQAVIHQGSTGSWLTNNGIGVCHLLADGQRVNVYPDPDADPGLLGLLLAGQVPIYAIARRGIWSLHASAVVVDGKALAFLGPHGQGKSTMAAAFLKRGVEQLTDDALALHEMDGAVVGVAGPRFIKLWSESAGGTLALGDDIPSLVGTDGKKRVEVAGRFPTAARAPLGALYLLERFDAGHGPAEVTIAPVRPRDAIAALLGHLSTSMFLQPRETATLLPMLSRLVAQAPLWRLRYPSGYEHQGAIVDAVLRNGGGA